MAQPCDEGENWLRLAKTLNVPGTRVPSDSLRQQSPPCTQTGTIDE